jgi:hypothetical protein
VDGGHQLRAEHVQPVLIRASGKGGRLCERLEARAKPFSLFEERIEREAASSYRLQLLGVRPA